MILKFIKWEDTYSFFNLLAVSKFYKLIYFMLELFYMKMSFHHWSKLKWKISYLHWCNYIFFIYSHDSFYDVQWNLFPFITRLGKCFNDYITEKLFFFLFNFSFLSFLYSNLQSQFYFSRCLDPYFWNTCNLPMTLAICLFDTIISLC